MNDVTVANKTGHYTPVCLHMLTIIQISEVYKICLHMLRLDCDIVRA